MKTNTQFQPRLEALRGIAALMVAYAHSLGGIKITESTSQLIKNGLNVFGNGGVGVTLFFVLSGYVLTLSLEKYSALRLGDVTTFLIRRGLRIWPAMIACLLFCYWWINVIHHPTTFEAASAAYYDSWQHGASSADFLRDMLFTQNKLNPVIWTLQVEMIAAILFIPLWLICRRSHAFALTLLSGWLLYFAVAPLYSYARTGFIVMFILGILVPSGIRWVRQKLASQWLPAAFGVLFITCCLVNKVIPETQAGAWILEGLFAYGVITTVAASNGKTSFPLLDNPAARFLGRISYSFYLWHFPVLYIIGTYGFSTLPAETLLRWPNLMGNLLFIVSTLVALPVAWASYRFIETPFMGLTSALKPKKIALIESTL